jgi:hypothetical protein
MSSIIPVSLSQPDLRKCGAQPHPDLLGYFSPPAAASRCSSMSPVRCLSPVPPHMSPRNGGSCFSSHAGSPARAASPGPSRPTTPTILINSEELFYAGGSEYYTSDYLRGTAFSQKLAGPNFKINPASGWVSPRDNVSPSRDDPRRGSISANWEKSLEVERPEGRKYSLTDNAAAFPVQEIRDRSPIRDDNNNSRVGQHRRQGADSNRVSSPCCCFNDLCCKVCLVFSKEDSSLTLEQLQNRAIQNILKQKNSGNSADSGCGCGDCKPKAGPAIFRNYSPERSLIPGKKKAAKSMDALKNKVAGR